MGSFISVAEDLNNKNNVPKTNSVTYKTNADNLTG